MTTHDNFFNRKYPYLVKWLSHLSKLSELSPVVRVVKNGKLEIIIGLVLPGLSIRELTFDFLREFLSRPMRFAFIFR